jgi:hypothetical protein
MTKTPEKGLYYHYKHDPAVSVNNYSYEVLGIALDTEVGTHTVIYRPLYVNTFLDGADFCARPLGMFLETVEKEGVIIPRFTRIIDQKIIAEIERIRGESKN